MIQQTNREARRPPADSQPESDNTDGPEIWGNWSGRKHYSLEVVQHPLRARMCGFGDKDRRPLAPAAVAKMVVRNQDQSIVDVDEIDWSFFLVLVDLWSADGKQEMNLVLHPSSAADRYMPIQSSKNRRRGTSTAQAQQSGQQTPIQPSPAPSYRPPEPTSSTPLPTYTAHPQGYFSSTTTTAAVDPASYGPGPASGPNPHHPQQQDHPTWGGYSTASVDRSTTYPPPILPSIQTFAAASSTVNTTSSNGGWGGDTAAATNVATHSDAYHHHSLDKEPNNGGPVYASQPYGHTHTSIQLTSPPPTYSNANTGINANFGEKNPTQQQQLQQPPVTTSYPPASSSSRLAYTRTLVGPLSANACKLQDEHRKPGIFFLFQDLSVRTEGTFRLRMRLMNVGAPPAPEYGATKVRTDASPVLAQTFTDAFTVFSAKRFPGVPDTTALSIAFGNQGQKIPLRNRHGPAKRRNSRRDSLSAEEEDDSEEEAD